MKSIITVAVVVTIALGATSAQAALIYSHSFDDLTDITVTGGGSVVVSTDQAVDGSNSLKFNDVADDSPIIYITPQIGGSNITDKTITLVLRYYLTGAGTSTHGSMKAFEEASEGTLKYAMATAREVNNFPAVVDGNLAICSPTNGDGGEAWVDSGVAFPTGQWFTIAVAFDSTATQAFAVYASAGTTITTDDYVEDWGYIDFNTARAAIDKFMIWPTYGGNNDMYIDQLEIYSNYGEVPEPGTLGVLVIGGAVALLRRRHRKC